MKTYKFILSALFTLWLSLGFSQLDSTCSAKHLPQGYPLTAMNSTNELFMISDVESNTPAAIITKRPEFVGNGAYTDVNDFLYSNLKFPEVARITGRSGMVKVQFDIEENGAISNVAFVESPDSSFNEEVLRLLNEMPDWKPALSGNDPVKTRYQLNINFLLR